MMQTGTGSFYAKCICGSVVIYKPSKMKSREDISKLVSSKLKLYKNGDIMGRVKGTRLWSQLKPLTNSKPNTSSAIRICCESYKHGDICLFI